MGEVVAFPIASGIHEDLDWGIDLLTAVDVAIRDLRDIEEDCSTLPSRLQAIACRMMLQRAFDAASRPPETA